MVAICLIINQGKEFNYRCTTYTCCYVLNLETTQKLPSPINMLRKIRQIDRETCIFSEAEDTVTARSGG